MLKSKLSRLVQTFQSHIQEANYETARDIADLGTQLAPEDTGDLKASGRVEPDAPADINAAVWGGGNVDYAIYQEYGTPNMAAQPYARPASDAIDRTFRYREQLKRWSRG